MAGKGMIIVVVVVVTAGVGVVGAAKMGAVNIPGLTPKKKALAVKSYTEDKDPALEKKKDKLKPEKPKEQPAPPKPAEKPISRIEPEAGAQHIADVWSTMDSSKIMEITKDWKELELAKVIVLMDQQKAAEILAAMDPKKASALSRAIQKQASIVPIK